MALPQLKYDGDGLVTVVVQDRLTGEIRMLAHANEQALRATLASGQGHFYSRSRSALWRKGETSGNTLQVTEIWTDCDGDAVLYLVDPEGPTCHTGRASCFFRRLDPGGDVTPEPDAYGRALLPRLFAELEKRKRNAAGPSYTRKLLDDGVDAIGAKIREEADELARALASETDARVVAEAAEEIYHLLVGLLARDITLRDVEGELSRRFGMSGLAEKAERKRDRTRT
jgi:phosphoribosyl-AMP cyclohydrolase / phosphoribosyl-ATP pyrophosphohydrolase